MERWAPIGNAPGYEVSDHGNVRTSAGVPLKSRSDKDGYRVMCLHSDGRRITVKIHRLVALAFIGAPANGQTQVDHANGKRDDNRASNLRWVSVTQNKRNLHTPVRAASGLPGVRYRAGKPNPWQAHASVGGKFKNLGHYPTAEQARAARVQHETEQGYDNIA